MHRIVAWLLERIGVHIDIDPDAGLTAVRELVDFLINGPTDPPNN